MADNTSQPTTITGGAVVTTTYSPDSGTYSSSFTLPNGSSYNLSSSSYSISTGGYDYDANGNIVSLSLKVNGQTQTITDPATIAAVQGLTGNLGDAIQSQENQIQATLQQPQQTASTPSTESSPATTTDPNTNTTIDNNATTGPTVSDPTPWDPDEGGAVDPTISVPQIPAASISTDPIPIAPIDTSAIDNIQTPPIQAPQSSATGSASGLTGNVAATQASATAQDQAMFAAKADWRVRLSLAPGATYLYNSNNPGILKPLSTKGGTDGVIFPYTPQIQVSYAAKYSSDSPTHSNYAINQYTSSSIDSVSITGDFTAQDVSEANYLLAVIHFFRTMTKMFYGQDQNPKPGTPPPLCYMYGMGDYQFSAHPLAITNFTYSLPNDVDYIKTQAPSPAGSLQNSIQSISSAINRLGSLISPGGTPPPPNYGASQQGASVGVTWVPTKIQLSITCLPIISRNQISNQFSLADYASGKLLAGTRRPGGGMW